MAEDVYEECFLKSTECRANSSPQVVGIFFIKELNEDVIIGKETVKESALISSRTIKPFRQEDKFVLITDTVLVLYGGAHVNVCILYINRNLLKEMGKKWT